MAIQKFLAIISGRKTEVSAIDTSGGAGDAGKIPALDGTGKLNNNMMPAGIGADTKDMPSSGALAAGDFVNVFSDSGTIKARKADATTSGKEADGFVLAATADGATATVYFESTNTQCTGLTLGARYYLGTTAGAAVTTAPSASGNVVQYLGRAISATEISFEADDGVILA